MSYFALGSWVEVFSPCFHAREASAVQALTEADMFDRITYTNGSLTETTKTLPALLSLSLLM